MACTSRSRRAALAVFADISTIWLGAISGRTRKAAFSDALQTNDLPFKEEYGILPQCLLGSALMSGSNNWPFEHDLSHGKMAPSAGAMQPSAGGHVRQGSASYDPRKAHDEFLAPLNGTSPHNLPCLGSRRYTFNGHGGLSPEELFLHVLLDTAEDHFGVKDIIKDAGGALAFQLGQPRLSKRKTFKGVTGGTSPASVFFRQILDMKMPFSLPTITGSKLTRLRITSTMHLGAFVGRSVPVVGAALLAEDAAEIMYHTVVTYNRLVDHEDRL